MRILVAITLVSLAAGCSTYSVRRSALVPMPAPSARSGAPLTRPAELAVFSPRVAELARPSEGDGANAGLYLPRVQVDGAARFRVNSNFDVGLLWDQGLSSDATAITPDQPKPRNGSTFGGGVSMFYSAEAGHDLRIGFDLNVLRYSVPYIEYRTCVDYCDGATMTDVEDGRRGVWVASVGLVPSYQVGALTWFGGVTLRNHPTNTKGEVESSIDNALDSSDEIRSGPMNLILSGGVEWAMSDRIKAMAQIFAPVTGNPVVYAPTVGLGMSVALGR